MSNYGGQAIIEGVMMRGERDVAVAVRRPKGDILVRTEMLNGVLYTSRWAKLPLIRGVIMLWDMMALGVRTLMFSANVAMEEEETQISDRALWGTVIFTLLMAVGIFFVVPVLLVNIVDRYIVSSVVSNIVEKVIRLVLLIGYIAAIGFLPDIQRVFAYHGAEHKTINAYEAGAPLTVESVQRYSTAHPRCGTSFLLLVMVISFIFFILLGRPDMQWRILSRIILIPVVAGVAYEAIKLSAAHAHRGWVKIILFPGMALQKLTTRQPDASQIEVAIAALKGVLPADSDKQPQASQVG